MKNLILVMFMVFTVDAFAGTKYCSYDFDTKELSISYQGSQKTYTSEFELNNHMYKVHIENLNKTSDIDDYVTVYKIVKPEHKMTYALKCQ